MFIVLWWLGNWLLLVRLKMDLQSSAIIGGSIWSFSYTNGQKANGQEPGNKGKFGETSILLRLGSKTNFEAVLTINKHRFNHVRLKSTSPGTYRLVGTELVSGSILLNASCIGKPFPDTSLTFIRIKINPLVLLANPFHSSLF